MVEMYLDTDCVLALAKESDWLKEAVMSAIKDSESLCTSALTVVECRLVLLREESNETAFSIESVLKKWNIKILELDEQMMYESKRLMKEFVFLGTFDALHIATAILHDETILSTDHVFPLVDRVRVVNPRNG